MSPTRGFLCHAFITLASESPRAFGDSAHFVDLAQFAVVEVSRAVSPW